MGKTTRLGVQEKLLQSAVGADGDGNEMEVEGYGVLVLQTIGTFSATINFEVSLDESTYVAIQGVNVNDGTFATTSTSTGEIWRFDVSAFNVFRARVSGYGSGSVTVRAQSSVASAGGTSVASVDLNEPVQVEGAGADGSAETGFPVLIAGSDGTNTETMLITASGQLVPGNVTTSIDNAGNTSGGIRIFGTATVPGQVEVRSMEFNDTGWDRRRGNTEITLLASAARTVETDSSDTTNFNGRGILITVDWTSEAGTSTLTPNIVAINPLTSEELVIWTAATALSAVGNTSFLLYPGALAADFDGTESVSIALPRTFLFRMEVGTADSNTYSVSASIIL